MEEKNLGKIVMFFALLLINVYIATGCNKKVEEKKGCFCGWFVEQCGNTSGYCVE